MDNNTPWQKAVEAIKRTFYRLASGGVLWTVLTTISGYMNQSAELGTGLVILLTAYTVTNDVLLPVLQEVKNTVFPIKETAALQPLAKSNGLGWKTTSFRLM